MKKIILTLFVFASFILSSQNSNYNIEKGYIADGYDVVAYFDNKAIKGKKDYKTTFDDIMFCFSSEENLTTFLKSPEKYIPQYGGYCAYAIGLKNEKVSINPKTFEIREDKLYLFYNAWGTNTLDLWLQENPQKIKELADKNWLTLKK